MKAFHLFSLVLLSALLNSVSVSADKILVLVFFSSKSHKITYMRLIEELASRGHQITLVTPIKGNPTKNIKEVYTMDVEKSFGNHNLFEQKERNEQLDPRLMVRSISNVCNQTYDLPQVKALLKEQFDLIFMQPLFNDCVLGIVHKLKPTPFVLFFPTSVPNYFAEMVAGHLPPSFVPNMMLGYGDEMNFYQRFVNFGVNIFIDSVFKFYMNPLLEAIYREKLGDPSIPSIMEIYANTSLILSNGHFSINGPRPYLPDIVDVGGIHSRPAKALPKDLEEFVTKSGSEGFIYFSMGSALKANMMSVEKRKTFLKIFSQLKQQVLWKWESDSMEGEVLPKNVKLSNWLPQQDLLGHKNIKMFITHCGGGSTEESIFHGVPLLGVPIFGDQIMNTQKAKNLGFLVELDWNDVTEESLAKSIKEILNNPKYAQKAKKISHIFRDQPDDPLKRGVFWIEYILRHKGAPHLRSAARKLNYFQYNSFDVIAAYGTILLGISYLLFAIVRCTCRCICGSKKNTKDVHVKKIKIN